MKATKKNETKKKPWWWDPTHQQANDNRLQAIMITLGFFRKPLLASLWTNHYLRSNGMGKDRGDQRIEHFGGSSLCQLTMWSYYQGAKMTREMINKLVGTISLVELLVWVYLNPY
jgi:hypothetical protein